MSKIHRVLAVAVGSLVAGIANAQAAGSVDASGVLSGIDSSSVVTAIVAAGAIMALPGFAKWAIKKTASFFG